MTEEDLKAELIAAKLNIDYQLPKVDITIANNFLKANKIFVKEVGKALKNPIVKKPISKALYETWKLMDANEKERITNEGH